MGALPEDSWVEMIRNQKPCPMAYKILFRESQAEEPSYLADFALLRQLGIKTHIALASIDPAAVSSLEPKHNRRTHSFGAAHLAMLWLRSLNKS